MASQTSDAEHPGDFDLDRMLEALLQGKGEWVYSVTLPFAEAGIAKAQLVMGILHQVGLGVRQDGARALQFYRAAAEQHDPIAWKNLGTMHLLGLAGIPINKAQASECFARAKLIEIQETAKGLANHSTVQ